MQTSQLTNAKPCIAVQKEEWINTILIEITANPKITNNELAEKYQVHRNRISKYRNIIRQRQLKTDIEIVNKIDNVLEDLIPEMEPRDLIAYRRAVHNELNINANMNVKKKTLRVKIDLSKLSENERNAILCTEEVITRTEKTVSTG